MSATESLDTEIAVVGGGPSGLTAALALAASGASVALVAPPAPPEDHRTTALLTGSMDALARFGVGDAVAAAGAPLRTMRLVDATRRLVRAPEIAFHASELGLDAFGVNIRNRALTDILAAAVAAQPGIRRIETTATAAVLADGRVRIETAGAGNVVARLAVAADGRRSMLRDAAGIRVRTWSYPQTALVLNLRHSAPHFDSSTEFHTETGPFTLVPLDREHSSLVCVERPAEAERLSSLPDDALAVELERRARSLLGRMEPAGPRQTWPMSSLKADRLGANRICLVGETAHAFPPIGAQGLNLGIRDVVALADIVARARARGEDTGGGSVVDGYARARQADVATRTFGVDLLNRSLLTDFLPVQIGRAVMLQLARDLSPLRKLLMREGMRPTLFQSA